MKTARTHFALRAMTIITVCALMASTGPLLAQRRGGGSGGGRGGGGRTGQRMDLEGVHKQMQERAKGQFKQICKTLVLDKDQQKEADKLFAKVQDEQSLVFKDLEGENIDTRTAFDELRANQEKFFTEFAKILNSEQQKQFAEIKKELQQRRPQRRQNNK